MKCKAHKKEDCERCEGSQKKGGKKPSEQEQRAMIAMKMAQKMGAGGGGY